LDILEKRRQADSGSKKNQHALNSRIGVGCVKYLVYPVNLATKTVNSPYQVVPPLPAAFLSADFFALSSIDNHTQGSGSFLRG
jgi:hypothetical protein